MLAGSGSLGCYDTPEGTADGHSLNTLMKLLRSKSRPIVAEAESAQYSLLLPVLIKDDTSAGFTALHSPPSSPMLILST